MSNSVYAVVHIDANGKAIEDDEKMAHTIVTGNLESIREFFLRFEPRPFTHKEWLLMLEGSKDERGSVAWLPDGTGILVKEMYYRA